MRRSHSMKSLRPLSFGMVSHFLRVLSGRCSPRRSDLWLVKLNSAGARGRVRRHITEGTTQANCARTQNLRVYMVAGVTVSRHGAKARRKTDRIY